MKIMSFFYPLSSLLRADPRTKKAQLNTLLGLSVKGGSMLISLLLVPLTIDFLTKDKYGTWLTISSIVTMLTFLDIGIGNGLRNKFSEAVANQDTLLARSYVSTAYAVFSIIQILLASLFLLVLNHTPWQRIFNTNIDLSELKTVLLLTVFGMLIKLVLDILSYVLFALQEAGSVGFITLFANILILIGTYVLLHFEKNGIVYLATVTSFSPVIVLLLCGLLLYRHKLKAYRPSIALIDFSYAKSLLSLGYKFFIIQIAVIVIFYSDNIIITHLFGPAEVTTYNVAFRYFNAISTIFAIAIAPYWSAFTDAFIKNDIAWMRRTYSYLQKLWLVLSIVVVFMVLIASHIYGIWVGNRVVIPDFLNICMAIFIIISCWNSVTVAVANGLGKVRLQLYYSTVSAIINIPLAILFGKVFNIGSAGVVLATSASLLIGSVIGSLQAKKLVSGTAKGIWNR